MMQPTSTYLLYAFEIFGIALNTAFLYFMITYFIRICREKDLRKILVAGVAVILAVIFVSGIMGGEKSVANISEAVNFVLSLGITWILVIAAGMCLLMHTLFSLLHKKKPF